MPALELSATDLLDEEILGASLAKWAAYESVDALVLLPLLGRLHGTRDEMSEVAMRSLVSVARPELSLICLTTAQGIGRLRTGSPIEDALQLRSLTAVVELSAESIAVGVHPRLKMVLSKLESSPASSDVAFVSTDRDTGLAEIAGELLQMAAGTRRTEHGFVLTSPLPTERGLLPSVLDPARAERLDEASVIGELVRFGDLFEVLRSAPKRERPLREQAAGTVPVVTGRSLRDGRVDIEEDGQWIEPDDSALLEDGDLLVSSIAGSHAAVRIGRYSASDGPMVAARSILVARPKLNMSQSTIRVLTHFIRSSRFIDQFDSVQSGSLHLQRREMEEVLVPMPDSALLEAFDAVEVAESQFRSWRDEATGLMELSMEADDLGVARRNLLAASGLLRQRASAAGMLDDLGHRVATRYPLPIAYRWRSALAARGSGDDLRSVLHAHEVLQAYLGILAIVSARIGEIEMGALADIRKRLSARRAGLGIGDWRALLQQFSELKAVRRLPDTHPLVEVREFLADSDVVLAADRLSSLRNDVSHLREFGPGELEAVTEQAWVDLKKLFEAASFVTDYPLIRVVKAKWDTYGERNLIEYRQLSGDNPIVPTQTMVVDDNRIETESLYLVDRHQALHLLRPLLIGDECPLCGHWSTFHPDRIDQAGVVCYKSFEHGHAAFPKDIEKGLIAIGLLSDPRTG